MRVDRSSQHARQMFVQNLFSGWVERVKNWNITLKNKGKFQHHAKHDDARNAAEVVSKTTTGGAVN